MTERPPIYSWEGNAYAVTIRMKTGLYGSEVTCKIESGKGLGIHNPNVDARTLANALCEYLESQRPPEPGDPA